MKLIYCEKLQVNEFPELDSPEFVVKIMFTNRHTESMLYR